MGGCRCIFRSCTVSTTRIPGMHFFHFPIKDKRRFLDWVQMAGAQHILNFPVAHQKNRVVCARHFRDECFMNYKKDRLLAQAVPTLLRLDKDYALDYTQLNEKEQPVMILLKKPKQPHLIRPPGFKCPLGFTKKENAAAQRKRLQEENSPINEEYLSESLPVYKTISIVTNTNTDRNRKLETEHMEHSLPKAQKKIQEIPLKSNVAPNADDNLDLYHKPCDIVSHTEEEDRGKNALIEIDDNFQDLDTEVSYESKSDKYIDVTAILELPSGCTQEIGLKVLQPESAGKAPKPHQPKFYNNKAVEKPIQRKIDKYVETSARPMTSLEELKAKGEISKQTDDEHARHVDSDEELSVENNRVDSGNRELRRKLAILQAEHKKLQSQHALLKAKCISLDTKTVGASSSLAGGVKMGSSLTLTKAQLFNSIKRYLSPSMVALLRMEMFATADRDWKPDERRAASDLLQLGENVYKYFSDEWRFRLPPLRQSRHWLQEHDATIDEDINDI